jgi:uncharacterized protein (DUF849 family)
VTSTASRNAPLIINLAPTGAVADHGKNPNVPITDEAIAADVAACAEAGAGIVHLHVRDDEGKASSDPQRFASVITRLRESSATRDLVICASTSGRHGQSPVQRAAVVNLPAAQRPDMGSLTLGSLNFVGGASLNAPDTIRYLASQMQANGVKPELEVFDVGMIEFAKVLIREGLIGPPFYFNIVLGNVAGLRADIDHLSFALQSLPQPSIASVGGIGRTQLHANALGTVAADGVRVGLEDNLWSDWELKTPATNPGLVQRVAGIARAVGREIASPPQIRDMLGLPAETAS